MYKNGYIKEDAVEGGRGHAARHHPLRQQREIPPAGRLFHGRGPARADQALRRECRCGANSLYAGGLWVRTSMDPKLQDAAAQALRDGLARFDGGRGWRDTRLSVDMSKDWAGPARPGAGRSRLPRLAEGRRSVQGRRRSDDRLHQRVARHPAGFGGVDAGPRSRRPRRSIR